MLHELAHTLPRPGPEEVAQIARTIARTLGLNEDLTEALALVHDLGHAPFGHNGETILNDLMAAHGGFEHNRQALRIVEQQSRNAGEAFQSAHHVVIDDLVFA